MSRLIGIVGASLAVHVALMVSLGSIQREQRREATAIKMTESRKKKHEPPKPIEAPTPPEPPHNDPKPPQQTKTKQPSQPPKASAEQPLPKANASPAAGALDALPDFGLSLSGSTGSGGLAIPMRGDAPTTASTSQPAAKPKAPSAMKPTQQDDCADPQVKPRPISVPQPAYTTAAREASVEGKVRLELHLDERGNVTTVSLKSGLGHGLDQAALDAARRAKFEPATRCGKPVATTFTLSMRFSL